MPPQAKGRYDLREIYLWRAEDLRRASRVDRSTPAATMSADTAGKPSDPTNRFKLAKAQLAELDLATKREQVVDRASSHATWGIVADLLRKAGETLQRQFGADAAFVLEDALNNAGREVERFFGRPDAGGNPPSDR